MKTAETEKIQTGLTINYIPSWTVGQAIKEALQNMAYGAVKSQKDVKIYTDEKENMTAIRDYYTGFNKSCLYIGESGQRDDDQGLGNFGEGWKIFLLVMAREGIKHRIQTVGFDFWGVIERTKHDTDVLMIYVADNEKTSGTKVLVDVDKDIVFSKMQSFAALVGIDEEFTKQDSIIPHRHNELWINGVRIESQDSKSPIELEYSYNLCSRDMMNRDRTHVNTYSAMIDIRKIIFKQDENFIKEYVLKAIDHKKKLKTDVENGPYVLLYSTESNKAKNRWLDVLANLHNSTPDKIVIKSYSRKVNDQVKEKGYALLDTPKKWNDELESLGIRHADDIAEDRYNVVESEAIGGFRDVEKTLFAKLKKRIGILLPQKVEYRYVSKLENDMTGEELIALYSKDLDIVYVNEHYMDSDELAKPFMIESVNAAFKCETTYDRKVAYEQILTDYISGKALISAYE